MPNAPAVHVALELASVLAVLAELTDIARRRRSLPEFAERLLQIVEALPCAFESRRVNVENDPAAARNLTVTLQFTESFLEHVAALRALDRNFDAG